MLYITILNKLEYIDSNVETGAAYWYSVQAVNEETGLLSAWGVSGDMEWAINCAAPESRCPSLCSTRR